MSRCTSQLTCRVTVLTTVPKYTKPSPTLDENDQDNNQGKISISYKSRFVYSSGKRVPLPWPEILTEDDITGYQAGSASGLAESTALSLSCFALLCIIRAKSWAEPTSSLDFLSFASNQVTILVTATKVPSYIDAHTRLKEKAASHCPVKLDT